MSLPRAFRALLAASSLSAVLLVSGCTLTPVYGDPASAQAALALSYVEPDTRLVQVFYRAIGLRLPGGQTSDLPELSVRVTAATSEIGLSSRSSPVDDYQVVARAVYTVRRDGEEIASGTRTATAGYQTTGQIVADDTARDDAIERAVEMVAQTVRLDLIGQFAQP